jgi:hypothetical protein
VNRGLTPWAGLIAGLAMAWFGFTSSPEASRPLPGAVVVVRSAVPTASPEPGAGPRPSVPGGTPLGLVLPALGVEAPVVPVDVHPDRSLGVPDDPGVVGWWRKGAWPGSGSGSVVLDGHVDTRVDGPGAFFHLADLRPGDQAVLETTIGTQPYVVVDVRRYPKEQLPLGVFDVSGAPRLVLISCGGPFDPTHRRYTENVVVDAAPLAPPDR